jgi:predicted AlkP superfamily phosphohydrolase/phosphomutase
MSSSRRLAMFGLDAADLGFIQAAPGALPNLSRILAGGALHRLRSPADLLPGSVWPTFYTASGPGEHGMYHHLQWNAARMRLERVTNDWLYCEPFWYDLERRGRRVVALDVPLTFPPRLRDGVEVLSWGSHDDLGRFECHPKSLEGEIRRRFGRHPMGCEIPVGKKTAELAAIRDNLVRGAGRKGALIRWLLSSTPWDFFIAVFGETHRGGHILWPDGPGSEAVPPGAVLDVYRAVDEALGDVLSAPSLAGAGVIVFSLHGMQANTSQEQFVPRVMDLINARFDGKRSPEGSGADRPPRGIIRRLRERVPPSIQNLAAHMVPVPVRDAVINRSIVAGHDWPHTPGFDLLSDLNGYLRLNVRGRERNGAFDRNGELLARYVDWLRDCFASLRIPESGQPLVAEVHLMNETFPGSRVDHLPDIVVRWAGHAPVSRIESAVLGSVTAELATGRSGNHHREGFCVVTVPGEEPSTIADGIGLASFVRRVVA